MNYQYRGKGTKKSSPYTGPKKAAILKSDIKGQYELVTPWDQDFLDELKSTIQPSSRHWNTETKRWIISEIVLEDVVRIMKRHFDEVTTDLAQPETNGNLFEQVFAVIPKEYMPQIYRALAQAVHPDHGGSEEMFKQLNNAYEKVN